MRLSRDTALKIHYVLDQWIPPWLRDQRWFVHVLMKLAAGDEVRTFLDFKDKAPHMSEEEFRETYRQLNSAVARETDLNRLSVRRILEEVRGPKVLEVGCGRGYLAGLLAERSDLHVTESDIVLDDGVKKLAPRLTCVEANVEEG